MIYIAVFVVVIIAVMVAYLFRLARASAQRARMRRHPPDPETQTMQPIGDLPTLNGVARDMMNRMFAPSGTTEAQVPFHRRNLGEQAEAVVRDEETDPDLPSYQETSRLPPPPPASYQSPEMIRHEHASQMSTPFDEPPKYYTSPVVITL